ncbi:VanW family protein [Oceanobacillus sp. FSL H7-0719]|uniref:VanW family protein n=1 Tax=Oceanobacillus sp. FSL H7-0719 TaxID=2954507 RepID=UPI003250542F
MRSFLIFLLLCSLFPVLTFAENDNQLEIKKINLQKEELLHYQLSFIDSALIDKKKLEKLMHSLESEIAVTPINASYDENQRIIEGKQGKTLDRYTFKVRFIEAFYKEEDVQLEIPVKFVEPRIDAALLQEISQKKLGSYSTYFNSSNKERTNNIMLSADAINGAVIFPGEIFSFNKTVGERTKERGYQRAPVIVRGEFSEDIGGGICQVSSTLFNAADQNGIQMVERFTHSRRVPYVPPGRDATVSWWGPDFSFKNLYNEPIVIRSKATKGYLNIEIYTSETAENFSAD